MGYEFDVKRFAKDIASARDERSVRTVKGVKGRVMPMPLGLRDAAKQIGISAPTISRIERQFAYPDMETLLAVCAWMKTSPANYFIEKKKR